MIASPEWVPVTNTVTGDRMLVLHRGLDAEGEVLEVQFDLPPQATGGPMHRHRRIQERFEVLDGALRVCVDGHWRTLLAGDSVTVDPGQAHSFANDSSAWVTIITEFRPPLHFERSLRTWHGLANTGRASATGAPRNLFHLARCLQDADVTFTAAPAMLQRAIISALVWLGNLTGINASLMDFDIAPRTPRMEVAS